MTYSQGLFEMEEIFGHAITHSLKIRPVFTPEKGKTLRPSLFFGTGHLGYHPCAQAPQYKEGRPDLLFYTKSKQNYRIETLIFFSTKTFDKLRICRWRVSNWGRLYVLTEEKSTGSVAEVAIAATLRSSFTLPSSSLPQLSSLLTFSVFSLSSTSLRWFPDSSDGRKPRNEGEQSVGMFLYHVWCFSCYTLVLTAVNPRKDWYTD